MRVVRVGYMRVLLLDGVSGGGGAVPKKPDIMRGLANPPLC